jgi:lipopolysaccharide transport system ATP-binding protein
MTKSAHPSLQVSGLSKCYRRGIHGIRTLRQELDGLFFPSRHRKDAANSFYALQDVSFSLQRGAICGVMGPNGSGKSTLMKLISSITEPTEGEIVIYGQVASLLEVGAGFDPDLDGMDNIFLNGAVLGMSRREIQSKLDQIIEFAGIGPVLSTQVKHYSSGMYVRLAFAVAAHLDSDILLIDEIFAVGDADFQTKCFETMKDLSKRGRTILLASHSTEIVSHICTQAIYLEGGRLSMAGNTAQVIEAYTRQHGMGEPFLPGDSH